MRTIDNVYNEIVIGQPSSFMRNTEDELITAQIRARLTASPAVRAININIETFHGNVYLMGTARSEQELRRAKDIAVQEMLDQAKSLGANAVVGVDLDYETVGQSGGMLMVSASGTAVSVE